MFKLSIVQVSHEDGIPVYLGMPMGLILEVEGKTIYHMGDTGLFSDMKLIAERHPVDVCFVPIGDNLMISPILFLIN